MDHIDNILSSDLLERYVLGDVTQEEIIKVDLLKIEHKVIRKELLRLEKTVERMSVDNAVKAPSKTKDCIIKNISGQAQQTQVIKKPRAYINGSWWKMAAAVMLGILGTWMFMQNKFTKANEAVIEMEADMAKLEKDCNRLTQQYAFINHSRTTPFLLDGKAYDKESQVIVYWNEDLQKSKLRVIELPAINANQNYQLWADVDGEMLSLGIFDPGTAIVDAIDINFLANASSLNITVEPSGGSEHPNISTLTASIAI